VPIQRSQQGQLPPVTRASTGRQFSADSGRSLRSVIAGDRTVVRCRPIAEVQHYLVDVTPSPAFGWVIAFDDRVPRLVEVLRGMMVRRVVAATDMAAGPAQAQMQPRRPNLQTFLASRNRMRQPRPAPHSRECLRARSAGRGACGIQPISWPIRRGQGARRPGRIGECSSWHRAPERGLAGYDDVAVGRDRKIEGAEFRISHRPRPLDCPAGTESNDRVVALATGTDP
jgi:hypothetical protein